MATLLNSISDILKRQYEGPIREQLNLEALIYNLFSEGPHQWAGSNVIIPLHTRGVVAGSIVYGAEGQVVPAASNQDYLTLTVGYSSLYASFSVTGQAEASAPGNGGSEAAFVGAMFSEMRGLEQDIRHSLDRDMFCGKGCWGWLIDQAAGTAGGGGGVAHTERKVSGANNIAARLAEHTGAGTVFYVKVANVPRDNALNWNYLEDATGGAPTANGQIFKITACNVTDGTVTIESISNAGEGPDSADAALVATSGLMIVETNNVGTGARILTEQCHGLNALGWDDAYFSNPRAGVTNTVLRGFAYSMPRNAAAVAAGGRSSGTDIDLATMQRLVDAIEDNCGENVDCLIMNRFTRSEYRDIFQDTIIGGGGQGPQYLPGETNAKGGFTTSELMFDQRVPIKVSNQAPLGVVYFVVRDTINTYTLRPGGFQEFNDAGDIVTQARDAGSGRMTDIREGFWKQYFDLVSEKPRALGVLVGIQYTRV
tara:strand:+ start:6150 stop:7598 length:1449 start_codon:yes stop_codon:yes gene_type:complete